MRRFLPLVVLFAVSLGCGKKPAPAPNADAAAPGGGNPETPAPAEPSERDILLTKLKTKRGNTQRDAADNLAELAQSDPATLDALVELLKDKTTTGPGKTHPTQITSTREAAAVALLHAGPKGEAALKDKGLAALREGTFDKDPAVREHTARTLEIIGPAARPLSSQLLRLCTDEKPEVRAIAFDALRSVGVADVPALAALLNNKEPDVKRRAAELVSVLPEVPPAAVFSLAKALDDDDEVIRVAAAMGIMTAGPKAATKEAATNLAEAVKKSFPPEFDPATAQPDGPGTIFFIALSKLGKLAVPPTLPLLKHKNWMVRYFALQTLGEIGPEAKDALPTIRDMINDPECGIEAVVALCRVGEKDLDNPMALMKSAFASSSPGVPAMAVDAVARMGPPGKPLVPAALKQLSSTMPDARYAAVGFVGTLEPAEAAKQVPELAKLAADPEPLIRRRVGLVLEKLGPAGAGAADSVGKVLLKETDDAVRDQFVDTLVAMGPGAKPAVAGLIPIVTDTNATALLRIKVIGAVVAADPASKDTADALVKAAADKDQNIRAAAAAALGKLNPLPESALAALVKLMRTDSATTVRAAAVRGLAAAGPRAKAAKGDLEAVANGTMPGLALWAKVALTAADGDVRKAGGVVREGFTNRNSGVRAAAADALSVVGPTAADVPNLLRVSRDTATGAKAAAAKSLGIIGPEAKDAVPRLVQLLDDKDGDTRAAAAEALGRIGPPAAAGAIPKLREAMRSDPLVAPAARKALDRLGAKDDGPKR